MSLFVGADDVITLTNSFSVYFYDMRWSFFGIYIKFPIQQCIICSLFAKIWFLGKKSAYVSKKCRFFLGPGLISKFIPSRVTVQNFMLLAKSAQWFHHWFTLYSAHVSTFELKTQMSTENSLFTSQSVVSCFLINKL